MTSSGPPCRCGRPLQRRPFAGRVVTSQIHTRTARCEQWERDHPEANR